VRWLKGTSLIVSSEMHRKCKTSGMRVTRTPFRRSKNF
jgi:hypothetical protein